MLLQLIVIPKNAFYFKGTSQNEHTVLDGACSEVSSWNQSISFNDEWMNFWYFFLINRKIIYVRHHDLSFFIWWQVWNFYQSIAIALTLSNAVCCTPTTNNSISTQPYLIQSFVIQMKYIIERATKHSMIQRMNELVVITGFEWNEEKIASKSIRNKIK